MTKLLVTYTDDWSDELDIYGALVVDEDDWAAQKKAFLSIEDEIEFYFGTNEEITKYPEEHLAQMVVQPISDDHADFLAKAFPGIATRNGYGNMPELMTLCEGYSTPEIDAYWDIWGEAC